MEINSMVQVPYWEADSNLAGQEILRLLCNLKVYYRVYESQP
jgi:hypothetical protein